MLRASRACESRETGYEDVVRVPAMACWRAGQRRASDGTTVLDSLKRVLVGRPLATSEQEHQRMIKTIALAVFSSDAISSTAYATQEILLVIAVGASSLALGLSKLVPISIVVARAARDRRHVVPPDDLRLPERRRFLRRQPREPRRRAPRWSRARRCSSTTSSPSRCRCAPACARSRRSPRCRR